MFVTVRLVGRNKVGDIPVNEEFARVGTKDRRDVDPAADVSARHRAGALTVEEWQRPIVAFGSEQPSLASVAVLQTV